MKTIKLNKSCGEGKLVSRVVVRGVEKFKIIGPEALAKDNDYRQGAILTKLRPAWDYRAMGHAGLLSRDSDGNYEN